MKQFTYSLHVSVKAMNEGSAKKKLKGWLEPSLAMKKNSDITAKHLGLMDSEQGATASSKVKSSPKRAKKVEPEYDEDWDDDFDELNWDELDEDSEDEDLDSIDEEVTGLQLKSGREVSTILEPFQQKRESATAQTKKLPATLVQDKDNPNLFRKSK